jgi:uncharacterized membrane protein YqjE
VANYSNHEKSIAEVLGEMRAEASAFINTRYELLAAELKEKSVAWKRSIPMLALAVVFTMGTFATFTFTLVALITALIRNGAAPDSRVVVFAWPISAIIICACYGGIAATLGMTGYKRLTAQSLVPERTVRVLKQDQQWIKEEARAA